MCFHTTCSVRNTYTICARLGLARYSVRGQVTCHQIKRMKQEMVRVYRVRISKVRLYLELCQLVFRETVHRVCKAVWKFRRCWVVGRQASQDCGADVAVVDSGVSKRDEVFMMRVVAGYIR